MASAVIKVSPRNNTVRREFFEKVFSDGHGWVCTATISPAGQIRERYTRWPEDTTAIVEWVNREFQGQNLYFCPTLLSARKRNKQNVVDQVPVAWADLDTADPTQVRPEPSFWIETSPSRWHGYWQFNTSVPKETAESISHRIALGNRELGVDPSGWDLSQLLRVPITYNYKYEDGVIVDAPTYTANTYDVTDFDFLPSPVVHDVTDVTMPDIEDIDPRVVIAKYRRLLPAGFEHTLNYPEHRDRSRALFAAECSLLEAGMHPAEVLAVLHDTEVDKFTRDGRPLHELWQDILRAQQHVADAGQTPVLIETALSDIITEDERRQVAALPDTFLDRYVRWGTSRTDATPEYHVAGALTCLSSVVAGSVRLPTHAEEFKLNLWCLILADSTVTRKSTAMRYAQYILQTVNPDVIAATDASLEGLLQELSKRPNQTSLFFRDEVSGLFSSFKKEYMSGLPQMLSHLYDGTYQKRVLRKETIEVKDPTFLFFGGGVIQRTFELTDENFVTDGFFPRFLFFVGESDMSKFEPLGPPTTEQDEAMYALISELEEIRARYDRSMTLNINSQELSGLKHPYRAMLTPEAWARWQKLERQFAEEGLASTAPHLFQPMLSRLAISILKVACLIACSHSKPTDHDEVIVELPDVLQALQYGDMWRRNAAFVVNQAERGMGTERVIEKILEYIRERPNVTSGEVMRRFRLMSNDATKVFDTMVERGLITKKRVANGWRLQAVEVKVVPLRRIK